MRKVVVERPRHGRSWAASKAPPKPPYDNSPRYESMKARHTQRKWFSDLLGPLKRWLQSQVGRPWNDVHSEACAVIKPDSVIRAHIKTHLLEFVERNTFMHEGKICVLDTWRTGSPVPVTESSGRWRRFFVHPETGILHAMPNLPRMKPLPRSPELRWLGKGIALKQIHGLWFECHFIRPDNVRVAVYDYALEHFVRREELSRHHHRYILCVRKRQLSRRELRHHGLRNEIRHSERAQSSAGSHCRRLTTALCFSAGRRLWVLVNPAIPVQIRSVACDGGATFSTPGNSTVAFLPALTF